MRRRRWKSCMAIVRMRRKEVKNKVLANLTADYLNVLEFGSYI